MEALEVLQALARGSKQDGRAGHATHGQRRTASGVAVKLGQDDTREAHAVAERSGRGDGVLADHGVQDKHDLVGAHGIADRDRLVHHLLIDAQAAGGIDDDDVDAALAGEFDAGARNLDGVTHAIARLGGPHLDAGALADDLELLDSVGALEVGGHEEDGLALLAQPLAELSGQRRLTSALEASQHEDGRAGLCEGQLTGGAAQNLNELVVNDRDDLLAGVEGLGARRTVCLLTHLGGELTNDGEGDIRLDECAANIGNRLVDVRLGQDPTAAQGAEGLGQAI